MPDDLSFFKIALLFWLIPVYCGATVNSCSCHFQIKTMGQIDEGVNNNGIFRMRRYIFGKLIVYS